MDQTDTSMDAQTDSPIDSSADTAPAPRPRFAHLHLHSEYSLLDGGNRLDKLVARVKELGMDSVAVTDHGNVFAAVNFYEKARAAGIKPILGVEAYVAPGERTDRTFTGVADGGYHLVLLAENIAGWNNLMELCSEAYLTGFYFKPRMDRAILERCNEGLIAINGHLGSELAHHLVKYEETKDKIHWERAVDVAQWHQQTFAPVEPTDPDRWASSGALNKDGRLPRFYVELQHHIGLQNSINPHLIRLARELDLPLVCDNDSHFLHAEDHDAHDTLVCISTGKKKSDDTRMIYPTELFVKSPDEMLACFDTETYNNDHHGEAGREALANTVHIADRCDVELPIGANHAPVVVVKSPPEKSLPKPGDKAFAGDLTAWFKAFCAAFALEPANDSELDQDQLKEECDKALRMLAEAGMVWRYGTDIVQHRHDAIEGTCDEPEGLDDDALDGWRKWARLNRELKILADKLISAYFLIVWDFVNWGRQHGIPAIARGSGVGTMVGYVLGLSNACPVRYGLLFERFTDPDRSEYPDIDIDLCQDGRGDVINYVRAKYGHVAQIITFGTMKARAAIRDVARVLDVSLPVADRIAKIIPESPFITFQKAIDAEPDFKDLADAKAEAVRKLNDRLPPEQHITSERLAQLISNARVLEGQARHCSVHAAGVIVATRPLHELVPLYKQSGEDAVITQWDGPTCEKMGLLKMDFLGLRTLSIVERAKKLIRETLPESEIWRAVGRERDFQIANGQMPEKDAENGASSPDLASENLPSGNLSLSHPLDLDRLNYKDQRVFEMFRRGDTTGVFQFESGGMRRLLVEMRPDRLEDLIAANALFRPGPMDLIPDYNRRKHGDAPVPKVHEIVDRFTAETYGVMVYQEQVMQIVHELGGIPLRAAYALIKAISKKKKDKIDAARPKFVEGAGKQGLAKKDAEELFELILKFAGYGFNKSHSTGYAIVAYQTAYLKTFFPAQYMAAFLTFESQAQKVSDWIPYLEDCKRTVSIDPRAAGPDGKPLVVRSGIEVRPPDVNLSQADFTVVHEPDEPRRADTGHIRFGLKAIKGAGAKAIESIITERETPASSADNPTRTPYSSIFDFAERVPPGTVNKATIEALVKSGAFDAVHGRDHRAAVVATIDRAVSAGQKIAKDLASGQNQLFGFGPVEEESTPETEPETPLASVEPWTESETLRQEKETLGFYVSSHPLIQWKPWTSVFTRFDCGSLRELPDQKRVVLPIMVQNVRTIVAKNGRSAGQKMAILTVEDVTGAADAVLFPGVYAQYGHLLEGEAPMFMLGRLDLSRGDPQILVDKLVPIDGVPLEKGTLRIELKAEVLNGHSEQTLTAVRAVVRGEDQPEPDAAASLASTADPAANGMANGTPNGPADGVADPLAHAAGADPHDPTGQQRRETAVQARIWIETERAWIELEPRGRVPLRPEPITALTALAGEGAVRLMGGVSVDMTDRNKKPWQKRGA